MILDSAAGVSIFGNKALFRTTEEGEPICIDGINKQGAAIYTATVGETPFGRAYYSNRVSGNILSFGDIVDNSNHLSYDDVLDEFLVQSVDEGPIYRFQAKQERRKYISVK